MIVEECADAKFHTTAFFPIAVRSADERMENSAEKLSISRTITEKVMTEKSRFYRRMYRRCAALGSRINRFTRRTLDYLRSSDNRSNVHGVIYPTGSTHFPLHPTIWTYQRGGGANPITVENVKSHKRLAREIAGGAGELQSFMPEYVVKQLLKTRIRLSWVN